VGNQWFLGVDPPSRLQAWPKVRRVEVNRTPVPVLELAPLAVDRARLTAAVAALLARTPLTDLASCARASPPFAWSRATLSLVATRTGRALAFRALARLPASDADLALGRATRELLEHGPGEASPVLTLLGERVLMEVLREPEATAVPPVAEPVRREITLAQALGALAAREALERDARSFAERDRARLHDAIARAAGSPAGAEATALLSKKPETRIKSSAS
jgi:hypothetical protein